MSQDLAQVLRAFQQELEESERELVALQLRVEGLRETTDGIKKLMRSERDASSQAFAEVTPVPPVLSAPPALFPPSSSPDKKPTTIEGALRIIQSDLSRSWPVREIWQNMVDRGWVANTTDSRSAVRIALKRLAEKHPGQLERVPDPPTFVYRWKGEVNTGGYSSSSWRMVSGGRADS